MHEFRIAMGHQIAPLRYFYKQARSNPNRVAALVEEYGENLNIPTISATIGIVQDLGRQALLLTKDVDLLEAARELGLLYVDVEVTGIGPGVKT